LSLHTIGCTCVTNTKKQIIQDQIIPIPLPCHAIIYFKATSTEMQCQRPELTKTTIKYCINCDKVFEKKNKGFKRKSLDANLPNSYRSILETTLEEPVTNDVKFKSFSCPSNVLFNCSPHEQIERLLVLKSNFPLFYFCFLLPFQNYWSRLICTLTGITLFILSSWI
jgi:hypothetical protein